MTSFEEKVYVSEFNIQPTGCIGVRKTTEILKDGLVVSSTYWRCVLVPNPQRAGRAQQKRRHRTGQFLTHGGRLRSADRQAETHGFQPRLFALKLSLKPSIACIY